MIAHLLFIAITFNSLHINKVEREPAQPSHVWAGCTLSGPPWEALCPQHRQDAQTLAWVFWKAAEINRVMGGGGCSWHTSPWIPCWFHEHEAESGGDF